MQPPSFGGGRAQFFLLFGAEMGLEPSVEIAIFDGVGFEGFGSSGLDSGGAFGDFGLHDHELLGGELDQVLDHREG